ncbi:hypothetical protein SLS53_005012 [Cytospora paraplurivora]|uniref:Terpene synthase n=1 Tax=Cytospora paraplurivora TaxID=2898453 RepID=A0AAN9YGG9_9PEZI
MTNDDKQGGAVTSLHPSVDGEDAVISDQQKLADTLRPIYTQFIADLNLKEPFVLVEPDRFLAGLLEYAKGTGVPFPPNSHSFNCLMVGYSSAGNCFPNHPFEVKVWIGIFTWLATLCDDAASCDTVDDIQGLQERMLKGEKQPTVITQAFADHVRKAYDYWEPLVANLIVSRAFEFLTSTALSARIDDWTPDKGGQNFPWYLRDKGGVGEAYAWFTFPKAKYPDMRVPIQAMADMNKIISLVNDVLSFYKEELNGDVDNYIHSQAAYNGIDIIESLKWTAKDAIDCARRIEQVLEGKGEYEKAWKQHSRGYIEMHLMRGRYRLWEVGIGSAPDSTEVISK